MVDHCFGEHGHPARKINMTIVWLIIALLAVFYVVVAFGSILLRFFVAVAAVVSTPIREIVRLYKCNQKKKARTLLASFSFAILSFALLIWLLVVTS